MSKPLRRRFNIHGRFFLPFKKLCLLAVLLLFLIVKSSTFLGAIIILLSIGCVWKSRKHTLLFLIAFFMAYCNYSIVSYYWMPTEISTIEEAYFWFCQYDEVMNSGINALYTFTVIVYVFFPSVQADYIAPLPPHRPYYRSEGMSLMIALMVSFVSAAFVLSNLMRGVYNESEIFEYMGILYVVGFYHAANSKKAQIVLVCLLALDVLYIFTNGDRMSGAIFLFIFFAFFLKDLIPRWTLLLILIFGVFFMTAMGMWRGNGEFNLTLIWDSVQLLFKKRASLDTAYASEAAGLSFILLAERFSVVERLVLLIKFLLAVLIGTGRVGVEANLPYLSNKKVGHHSGGGVLPNFGMFYLGYFGVIALALLLVFYLRLIAKTRREYEGISGCVSVYVFCTMVRWYLYTPLPLLRGIFLLSIIFFLSTKIKLAAGNDSEIRKA